MATGGEAPAGTVTFLFSDLEGSTRLWEGHRDAMPGALARHDAILRDAVLSHGGYVVKTTGDGIHAAFRTADDAVRAAIEGQRALADQPWDPLPRFRVRMGIHTGAAELREGDYYGPALNRAARLMAAAHGGQIVTSTATEELIRDDLPEGVTLGDLGVHRLRDLGRADRVFQLEVVGLSTDFPPLRSLESFPGNLPVQLTTFVGRDVELKALADTVRSERLVTLTGVGGVGKTRLAVQVAADLLPEFAGGAWLCELAGAEDAESTLQLVAATLNVQPRPGIRLDESIVEYLQAKQLLLILDNCEHVIDTAGRLAEAAIARCPDLRVMATSREGLAVAGEQVWPLRTLAVPDTASTTDEILADAAVLLFVDRARSSRPDFTVDEANAGAVAEICRRLDGIPLAIELAAARVVSMTPLETARRLDERFRLLTGGRRTAVERHQTLRATLDWSYSLLDERDRSVFERLGVFVGGFDSSAVEAVASAEGVEGWDAVDALADLVGKSLIVVQETAAGTTRYEMLETIRHYARERLDETSNADDWRRRHAEYLASVAEEIGPALRGPDELRWQVRLAEQLDDLRAAVSWALDSPNEDDAAIAFRIVAAIAPRATFDPSLGIGAWALRATARLDAATPGQRHPVLAAAAFHVGASGDWQRSHELASEALRHGIPADSPWPGLATIALFQMYANTGEVERGIALYEDALREFGDTIDPIEAVTMHGSIAGLACWFDVSAARTHAERAVDIARELANPSGLTSALYCYGYALRQSDPTAALVALDECVEQVRHGATPILAGYGVAVRAEVRSRRGDTRGALEDLRASVRYCADTGNESLVRFVSAQGAAIFVELGELESAAELRGISQQLLTADYPTEGPDASEGAAAGRLLRRLRSGLGEAGYTAAVTRGAARRYPESARYLDAKLTELLGELDDPHPRTNPDVTRGL